MKKVALITGSSSGIGFYTALKFARDGYVTYASVRNIKSDGVSSLKKIASQENLDIRIILLDVTQAETIKKSVKEIIDLEGKIDVLINNAGVMYLGPVETFSIDEVKEQFETNYFGALRVIKEVAPLMREQQSGYIINVSSINGLIAVPLYGMYSSSKYALESMSEVLRFELSHFGIKVALVEPGIFHTNFWKNRKHPASIHDNNSPYKDLVNYLKAIDTRQKMKSSQFLQKLFNPQKVANRIYKLTQQSNPPLRQIVGYDPKIFYLARRLLPYSIWAGILHRIYKW